MAWSGMVLVFVAQDVGLVINVCLLELQTAKWSQHGDHGAWFEMQGLQAKISLLVKYSTVKSSCQIFVSQSNKSNNSGFNWFGSVLNYIEFLNLWKQNHWNVSWVWFMFCSLPLPDADENICVADVCWEDLGLEATWHKQAQSPSSYRIISIIISWGTVCMVYKLTDICIVRVWVRTTNRIGVPQTTPFLISLLDIF